MTDGCRTLGEYVTALVSLLETADPAALWRLRQVVGDRWARLRLDDEVVVVGMPDGRLVVRDDASSVVDGLGATDRQTVLELLDGTAEVSQVLLDGRMQAVGRTEDVAAMLGALEILLDAAIRTPALQWLAEAFRDDPCRPPPRTGTGGRTPPWRQLQDAEMRLLADLDLLPDDR